MADEAAERRGRRRGWRRWAAAGATSLAFVVAAPRAVASTPGEPTAGALAAYVAAVEPIRDGVNRLLDGADPILAARRSHRITGVAAAAAMGQLEQQFAAYTAEVTTLQPSDPTLARVHAPYARTYLLEDAYLRALVAALPGGDYSRLPHTAEAQRRAIVVWRNRLEALGRRLGVRLPADLAHAGRGDIAPSPTGS